MESSDPAITGRVLQMSGNNSCFLFARSSRNNDVQMGALVGGCTRETLFVLPI
jgi:hypothetical protein